MNYIITGKANAGKTTLAKKIQWDKFKYRFAVVLDGDDMRIDFPLGYTDKEREDHIMRMGKFANILNRQKFDVIIAAVLPKKEWREKLREIIKEDCRLIYVKGGYLWEGTVYEIPTIEESPIIYDWRKTNELQRISNENQNNRYGGQ